VTALSAILSAWLAEGRPAVLVTVAEARGSTPREAGAAMLVSRDAAAGTVGGGRLELEAIGAARALLDRGGPAAALDLPLGPAIGQCCGGHVVLRLALADGDTVNALAAAERAAAASFPAVLLFGAGHVGRALARALAPLPLRLAWIDGRAHEFPAALPDGVERVVTDSPLDRLAGAPAGAGCLILTHSHQLDFELAEAALRRGDLSYAGLIGSATKRARFERWYRARGGDPARLAFLACPIGAGIGATTADKRPEVIAALAAAELMVALTRRRAAGDGPP